LDKLLFRPIYLKNGSKNWLLRRQPVPQPGIPLLSFVILDGNRHRPLSPDQDDKFLSPGDPGIEKISLKQVDK
jgi:hypothetical protein